MPDYSLASQVPLQKFKIFFFSQWACVSQVLITANSNGTCCLCYSSFFFPETNWSLFYPQPNWNTESLGSCFGQINRSVWYTALTQIHAHLRHFLRCGTAGFNCFSLPELYQSVIMATTTNQFICISKLYWWERDSVCSEAVGGIWHVWRILLNSAVKNFA